MKRKTLERVQALAKELDEAVPDRVMVDGAGDYYLQTQEDLFEGRTRHTVLSIEPGDVAAILERVSKLATELNGILASEKPRKSPTKRAS